MHRASIFAAILFGSVTSRANAQDDAMFRATKTFRCVFTTSASANMDEDVPKVTMRRESLEMVFDQIDAGKRTGRLIGNLGAQDVTVISGSEKLTLLEVTPNGTPQVTVIYIGRRSDGQFKAVHSRHTALLGGIPIPSQMYGSCRALV